MNSTWYTIRHATIRVAKMLLKIILSFAAPVLIICSLLYTIMLWKFLPANYVGDRIGVYPVTALYVKVNEYEPKSFRAVDSLYIVKVLWPSSEKVDVYLRGNNQWKSLPVSEEITSRYMFTKLSNDSDVKSMLNTDNGLWTADDNSVVVYDADHHLLYFRVFD